MLCHNICNCCHIRVLDVYGDHATLCSNYNQNPKRRHDAVKLLLVSMGRSAGLMTKLEQNPTTATTSNIKPADVLFENYQNGQDLTVDITIVSPFRCGVTRGAASKTLFTGEQAYLDKLKKYDGFNFKSNVRFLPFVMEEFINIFEK